MTESDLDLLRRFTRDHSQDAFGEIVRRHVDLVYSAALRQVRSPQLAEEVAQSVFSDLARNADKLKPDTVLPAWLYAVTRRTAVDVVRKESRRQLREQIAVEMNTMNATANDWNEIGLLLDDAMAALDETDRSVILLRFFENKSLREVGESLKISDDAAQKRAARAVERLREFYSKRNVTVGASGLTVLLAANAVQAAPVGMAATISGAIALTGAAASATGITTTKIIVMTTLQKAIIGAALTTAIGTGIFEARQVAQLHEQNQALQQQQAPQMAQIQQLQLSLSDATNQIAGLMEENARLESKSDEDELLKLRGEVTQLKAVQSQSKNDPMYAAVQNWLTKVDLLKQKLNDLPNYQIPELKFVTDRDWLSAANDTESLATDKDFRWDLRQLKDAGEDRFGSMAMVALQNYFSANNQQIPTNLSQLEPYFDPQVDGSILQRYEIVPSKDIPAAEGWGSPWLIALKSPDDGTNDSREVIGRTGYGHPGNSWPSSGN